MEYIIMTNSKVVKTSLKATKRATAKPSEAVTVLSDKQLLGFAPIVSLASEAFQYGKDCEEAMVKATLSMGEKYALMAQSFCNYMQDTNATWQDAQAYKQHLAGSVASVTGSLESTILKALTGYITKFLASDAKLENPTITYLDWAGSKNPSALSNKKARAEKAEVMSQYSDADLLDKIDALESLDLPEKTIKPFKDEYNKREKAIQAEQKKLIKASVDSLIKDIKATVMTSQQVACLSFAINNLQVIESVMRDKGVNKITDI
jgi:hypothetical protein